MKKQKLLLLAFVFTAAFLSAEGGVDFSGNIETFWGAGAPWTDKDSFAGRFTSRSTSFTGKLDAYYGNSSAYADAIFSYDAVNYLSGNLSNGFDLSLNELWLDYTDSFWGVRIGRQKAAWGKADGIDITNVLCPQDMSSLKNLMNGITKLSVDALRFSVNGNSFTADFWWIPFFTPASLPIKEGNSLRKFIVPENIDFPVEAMNTTLSLPVLITNFTKPELAIWNGEYGLKLSGYFSALDISLYGFYGWDDIPLLDYSITLGQPADPSNPATALPEKMTVSGEYKKMGMIGADAALPIGETVLRLETAFFPQRHFQKKAEKILKEKSSAAEEIEFSEKHNELYSLAGIDWMKEGWTVTAQYYCDVLFGELDLLERTEAYIHGATLSLSKTLLSETLTLTLVGAIGLNDFDSVIKPSVSYSLSDQISLGSSAYIFLPGPEKDGKYGTYKDLSCFCLNASFKF